MFDHKSPVVPAVNYQKSEVKVKRMSKLEKVALNAKQLEFNQLTRLYQPVDIINSMHQQQAHH